VAREAFFLGCVGALGIACGDSPREEVVPTGPSHLELTIARELSDKLGHPVKVVCGTAGCVGQLQNAMVPIAVERTAEGWTWRVRGLVVRSSAIETYLSAELADLGATQAVSCGAPVHVIEAGDRIACTLAKGGTAFAIVRADGSFSTEIELDPKAAAARTTAPAGGLVVPRNAADDGD
jgi:hypothetical protein